MAFMVVSEDGHIVFRQNGRPLRLPIGEADAFAPMLDGQLPRLKGEGALPFAPPLA